MKSDRILVCIKKPDADPYVDIVENTLETFQKLVGGYIESCTVASDLTLLCNEEGLLNGLPYNATICGNPFVGPVVAVGVDGAEFSSIAAAHIPFVLRMLKGNA